MLAAVRSAAVLGIEAYDVTVEVDVALGLPQWTIVGLAQGAVKESRERVCAALANAGLKVPPRRVTVNLAPADVRKEGTAFDLPIALGVLVALGQLLPSAIEGLVVLGELGLDGSVRAVRGMLPVARRLASASGVRALVLPKANLEECSLVRTVRLAAPSTLAELLAWLSEGSMPDPELLPSPPPPHDDIDFGDVVGQVAAKRALEIAAAGGHACLLIGPPGAGKTMLARRLPSILPPLADDEALEVIAIHSVAGLLSAASSLLVERPFRAPHHSISPAGLVGGGGIPRPGEVSLAHHGVLFLDELLEFPRSVLESLRQPMEDGRVVIARAATTVSFPARFSLVGAMNPCNCGFLGDETHPCVCSAADIVRYRGRLSGPLADRIDMHVTLSAVPLRLLSANTAAERSAGIRKRVEGARALQALRFARQPGIGCNAHALGRHLLSHGRIERAARELLVTAADTLRLSARAYHRVIKVGRTIADLEGSEVVEARHVAEALQYRPRGDAHELRARLA